MHIKSLTIKNYKIFKDFQINFKNGVNIIVGNNEAGKSTILEALHLALSGMVNGNYMRNEISQYLFNKDIENEYITSLTTDSPQQPPFILIEVFFETNDLPLFEGDYNSNKSKNCGVLFKIEFDAQYINEYNNINKSTLLSIPVEYYKITWMTFARNMITSKSIPIKSILIDSSSNKYKNGSDIYIGKIIKNHLSDSDNVGLSQAYRELKETFKNNDIIKSINSEITRCANISDKSVSISVDMSVKNSWENQLMTYLEDIPFHQIGQGEQCIVKTNLSLSHKKALESNLILIEEPENHLSYSKLNQFIKNIIDKCDSKQIIITTHSSFVANKLNLKNLILLDNLKTTRLNDLDPTTYDYFEKLAGYETLRLILCRKTILVEGPSDELIVQRANKDKYSKLPIEEGIDIISVRGLSFKRFLEIAKILKKRVAVITDNDGEYDNKITKKYKDFIDIENILISADNRNELKTLEPQIVDANKGDIATLCSILNINDEDFESNQAISEYMISNKTDVALKIFNATKNIVYPQYILSVIDWCHE